MLIVAINTASQKQERESAIALLYFNDFSADTSSRTVLGEESWHSNRNESERVLPGLDRLLKEQKKSWDDVEGVFVVRGPGSYTSLRVGITIANAIAWVRKIPLWTTDPNFTQLEKTDRATPLYAAPPNITPRK